MTRVFETQSFQDCPTEPIISVKEFAKYPFCSPKLHAMYVMHATFLNSNIMWLRPNSRFCLKEVKTKCR